jgi:hypothetical protein
LSLGGIILGLVSVSDSSLATPQTSNPSPSRQSVSGVEQFQTASAIATPVNGKISVRVQNRTNTPVSYEVIGQTDARSLDARTQKTLQSLATPTTITFRRPDGGLLKIQPTASETPGILEVVLQETTNFSQDNISMRIQQGGSVFLN